ncbi:MAG: hypothetical protein RJB39_570, partial [Candidatus Parcubacteria bacterium]
MVEAKDSNKTGDAGEGEHDHGGREVVGLEAPEAEQEGDSQQNQRSTHALSTFGNLFEAVIGRLAKVFNALPAVGLDPVSCEQLAQVDLGVLVGDVFRVDARV